MGLCGTRSRWRGALPGRALRRLLLPSAIPLLALSLAAPAFGQKEQDRLVAAELFKEGLAEMLAGAFETGCPKLSESYRRDPRPGTLFTLAECEAKSGLIASAVAHYEGYLELYAKMAPDQQETQKTRETVARAQLKELAPQVPRLTLTLPATAPKGTRVKRDGVPLDALSLGVAVAVDPGEHTVTTQAPGALPSEQKISLAPGDTKQLVLEVRLPARERSAKPPSGGSALRIAGFSVGGLGIAGIAAGAVTGGLALAAKGTVDEHCKDTGANDTYSCNREGKDAADRLQTLGFVSTTAFGVGLGSLALGAVLLVVAPSPPSSTSSRWVRPDVAVTGTHGASFGVKGVF